MKKANTDWIKTAGLAAGLMTAGCAVSPSQDWQSRLAAELPILGHRNWIVIADSAYPAQSRAGIETIATNGDHLEVVKAVLKAVRDAPHLRPNVYLDAEMTHVSENDAPGIESCRTQLTDALAGWPVNSVPHEQLIARLDEAAKTFKILVLKTNLTLPYTSVFLELDCGYWDAGAERRLRQAIQ
jgi:L-fucose mutarotase/ribose pyranase (RbsD/FucU family)